MMLTGTFKNRSALSAYEWQDGGRNWRWPAVDTEEMDRLVTRSTWNGLGRVAYFVVPPVLTGGAALVSGVCCVSCGTISSAISRH